MPPEKQTLTTDEEIRKSYWWITHLIELKKRFRYVLYALLGVWYLGIISYAILVFAFDAGKDSTLRSDVRDQTAAFYSPATITDIAIEAMGALQGSGQSVDLFASLKNPNPEWRVQLMYQFIADKKPLTQRSAYLYPSEQKYVLDLAQNISQDANIELQILSKKWYRMTREEERIFKERHRFEVLNTQYTPSEQTGAGFAIPVSSLSFTVKNRSPFRFNEITVPIIAKVNTAVVAAAQVPLLNVSPEEERTRVVQWFHSFPAPDSYDIRPSAPIFGVR